MNKVYKQSRSQNLFYRLYNSASQVFAIIFTTAIIAFFTDVQLSNLSFSLYSIVAISIIFTLWLIVFNTGKSKVIEHGIELNEQGISYIHYGNKQTVLWGNFQGFCLKGKFPRLVLLSNSIGKDIEFNYYAFSSSQRQEIFTYLSAK
ncbi:MAG: hypothetical protein ACSHW0_19575 [Thalassotalea sp.]